MELLSGIVTFLVGLLLRLGIPIGITALLIWILKRLDERWQIEAECERSGVRVGNPGCWEINQCPPERRESCDAYRHPEMPCWQFYRLRNHGQLLERCLSCKVFLSAPLSAST